MEWKQKYQWCIEKAAMYNSLYSRDIVHDMWVKHFLKYNTDIFNAPLTNFKQYAFTQLKREFLRWYYYERGGTKYSYLPAEDILSSPPTAEDKLIALDLYATLWDKVVEMFPKSNIARVIFKYKIEGHNQASIADITGKSKQQINEYSKKMSLLNPFNGSTIKVSRIILSDTWEGKKDKDDYELEDENEYYKLYKHKESNSGLLVKQTYSKKIKRNSYYLDLSNE